MGIKEDNWIRKIAIEEGMIEPFADSQVKLHPETGENSLATACQVMGMIYAYRENSKSSPMCTIHLSIRNVLQKMR